MKVLFCISGLEKGGAEKTLTILAVNGQEYYQSTVCSVFGGWHEKELQAAGVACDVVFSCISISTVLGLPGKLSMLIRKYRPYITCIHAILPLGGCVGVFFKLTLGRPLVYSIRSSLQFVSIRRNLFRHLLHKCSMLFADRVVANSPAVAQSLLPLQVDVMYNAVANPSLEMCEDVAIESEFFSDPERFTVVMICSMRPPRDLATLVKVAHCCPNMRFILVGAGELIPFAKFESSRLNISNIVFAGFRENIWPFLTYAKVFLLLTEHEGFPNTVLEAMVMNVPVVVSDIPEITQTLDSTACCWYVKNGDVQGIAQVLGGMYANPAQSHERIAAAKQLVSKRFSVDGLVKRNAEFCKLAAFRV